MSYRPSLHSLLSSLSPVLDGLRSWVDWLTFHNRKLLIIHALWPTSLLSHHPGLFIAACDYNLNLERQTLSIQWGVSGCGEQGFAYDQPVDVYLNDASSKAFSYDPQKFPLDPPPGVEYIQELIGFRTEHHLSPSLHASDSHTFHLFAFAVDPSTNLPVEITRLEVPDSLFGFTISSSSTKSTMPFSYQTPAGDQMMDVTSSVLMVEIERSNFSRGFEICIIATSWILTLGSAYIAVMAIRNKKPSKTSRRSAPIWRVCRHDRILVTNRDRGPFFLNVGVQRLQGVSAEQRTPSPFQGELIPKIWVPLPPDHRMAIDRGGALGKYFPRSGQGLRSFSLPHALSFLLFILPSTVYCNSWVTIPEAWFLVEYLYTS